MTSIGIVGTGFVAQGACRVLDRVDGIQVTRILSRRSRTGASEIDARLTHSADDLFDHADIILEASGDVLHATDVLLRVAQARKPILTIDAELHVTTGSHFAATSYISEADGDQPGCLARLGQEAALMGFTPLAYMNIKGFLNLNPERSEMEHWARVQNLRLDQVVSFTDGTKLQIEEAFVANGLGADILKPGLVGRETSELQDLGDLAAEAERRGRPISDYVLSGTCPPGVFLLGRNDEMDRQGEYGPYAKLKTRNGPYYVVMRPHHLIYLEILRALGDLIAGAPPLLNNSTRPRVGVAAVAKRPLPAETLIARGIGGFDVRGTAVVIRDEPDHIPIGLLVDARLKHEVAPGEILRFDDVELPESDALRIYRKIRDTVLAADSPDPTGPACPGPVVPTATQIAPCDIPVPRASVAVVP